MNTTNRKVWNAINGTIKSCFDAHPEYLLPGTNQRKNASIRSSLAKRLYGQNMTEDFKRLLVETGENTR